MNYLDEKMLINSIEILKSKVYFLEKRIDYLLGNEKSRFVEFSTMEKELNEEYNI